MVTVDLMVDLIVLVTTRPPPLPLPLPLPPPPRVMVTTLVVVMVATEVSVETEALTLAVSVAVAVAVGWVRVLPPVMMPLETSSMMLEETEGTAVTGQTTSVRTIVSVTMTVERASVGKSEKSSVLVGQSMTSGAHEVMVRTDVVDTVRVVMPVLVPLVVGKGAALVTRVAVSVEAPVPSGMDVEAPVPRGIVAVSVEAPVPRGMVTVAAAVESEEEAPVERATLAVSVEAPVAARSVSETPVDRDTLAASVDTLVVATVVVSDETPVDRRTDPALLLLLLFMCLRKRIIWRGCE